MNRAEEKTLADTAEKRHVASEKLLEKLDQVVDEMSPVELDVAQKRLQTLLKEARASRAQNRETAR
jgi:hypothetical protein